ncbi:CubicO group peptidase (beta-lactamase class C family) [Prosthecobacter fusiformis]|uniref:CubicO group peptidase (Beta-lactamase class C family) n=1 Tax=Prosthecobacter fusiformis TaxID=48464 RepID=A0A4V3FI51_9BACT|nr:serine hydrolase [Prosthecobacter fusiformis]TDU81103.1 CubicO group peptidase (beta-lactamase class C family) [Prosthecobacter fusiformis]
MRVLLPLLFFPLLLLAEDKPLAEVAKEAAKSLKAGGIATAESLDGKVTFAAFSSSRKDEAKYDENMLFEIGSITKVFTGLLLAQAVVEGKVTLDTPISELLDPAFTFADPRIAAITLKQLSTHTSGLPRLPDNHGQGVVGDDPYAGYNEKLLYEFIASAKLKGKAPYPCNYSNVGVGLLGHLLGKVYAMSWEEAIVAKICTPLGLQHTRMTITSLNLPLATPYDGAKKNVSWHLNAVAGAGALRATAADLLKFGQAMAKPEATPLAKAFALALHPHADAAGPTSKIGLGPFMTTRDGLTIYDHGGGTGGYRSGLQVIPEKNIVRVVLINNTTLDPNALILDTRIEPPRVMPKEVKLDAEALKDYPGVYILDPNARFTILLHKGQIWNRLTGQAFLPMFAKDKDQFFFKAVNAEIRFSREGDKIVSLTLFQNGRELVAKRSDLPTPTIALHTAEELKPYAGKYFIFGLTELNVTLHGRTLYAQLSGQEAAPIFDMGRDRFEFDVVEAAITFTRDKDGKIIGLILAQNGGQFPAARQEQPPAKK